MPFVIPGVAVPKTNYKISKAAFGDIDNVASHCSDDDDDDGDWMCTSEADEYLKKIELQKQDEKSNESQQNKNVAKALSSRYSNDQWLEKIEQQYFDVRDDLMRQTFHAAFDDVDDPYTFTLNVIHKGFFDLYSKRIPIQFFALEELDTWISHKSENNEKLPPLEEFHKRHAGEFVCRSGYNYLDKMTKLFKLNEGKNSFLVPLIQLNNLKSKKLKETVHIIYTLKLQRYFDTKEIALPLLANDQIQVLETYIGDDVKLQHDYVDLLDEICKLGEDDVLDMIAEKGLNLKDPSKVQHKTVIKIAEKAVKRYNLHPDHYPNIFRAKNLASLRYLVNQMNRESKNPDFSLAKWQNLIETSIRGNEWLEHQLLKIFLDKGDSEAAVFWAHKLDLKQRNLPQNIRHEFKYALKTLRNEECADYDGDDVMADVMDDVNIQNISLDDQAPEDWESDISSSGEGQIAFSLTKGFHDASKSSTHDYYQLSIPFENIHLVETTSQLRNAMKQLFQGGTVIAFDCEWKATMCKAGEIDKVALIQLAIDGRVYIIDIFKLYVEQASESTLQEFFTRFFTTKNVIKIGYGITGDLKNLNGMFAYMRDLVLTSSHLVDLCDVTQKVMSHPSVIPYLYPAKKAALTDKGLSLLINRTLGRPLDKTYQVSDWERRPLQREQLYYAALDSYALLEAYKTLQSIIKREKLKVNLNENVKLKWLKPKQNTNKRKDKFVNKISKSEIVPENLPLYKGLPRPTTKLKVVCDTMLQGLGRHLRSCGVDTLILANDYDHSLAINISRRENRVILTRGKPYFQMRGHLAENMCMFVPEGSVKEQLKMVFTRYNIALQTNDIFSRCNACNSSNFSQVKSMDIKLAYDLKYEIGDTEMPAEQLSPSGVIDLSNFTLTKTRTELQLDVISCAKLEEARVNDTVDWLFDKVDIFYVCEQCGKVYWEGSHHNKVKSNLAELIDKRESDKYYYATPG